MAERVQLADDRPQKRRGVVRSVLAAWLLAGLAAPVQSDDLQAARDAVHASESRRIEAFARAARSVVCIFGSRERSGGGSGVIIDERGYGLTNFHVVADFIDTRRGFGGLSDGRVYPLQVLGIDPGGDIVMFRLEGRERFDAAPLGDSDALVVGQWVSAMGNPFLVAEDLIPTITMGVISGLHRYQEGQDGNLLEYADCIQVSTSINPGNSGGPLFDLRGSLIGINGRASFDDARGRVNVGLGYAVSINQIKRFLPGLRAGRMVEHGTLGAVTRMVDDRLLLSIVRDFSAAARAELEPGDELLAIAGRVVRTPNDVNNILTIMPAGWPVTIRVRRGDVTTERRTRLDRMTVRLAEPYLTDIEHNRAELLALLTGVQANLRLPVDASEAGLEWVGTQAAGGADGTPFRAVWSPVDDRIDSPGSATQPADSIAAEWVRIVMPLLAMPPDDPGWQVIGGDEVDGRIVTVIEHHRVSGERTRWKIDSGSAALLEVTLGDEGDPELVRWLPGAVEGAGAMRWPLTWQRSDPDGALHLRISDVRVLAADVVAEETP